MRQLYFSVLTAFICTAALHAQSPTFVYAQSFGDPAGSSNGKSIATDAAGNHYVTGQFSGTIDFDPGPGTVNLSCPAGAFNSMYITKSDAAGNLIWAKNMASVGGSGFADPSAIAVDASGNVYTTGYFSLSIDFDPGVGASILTAAGPGNFNMFVSKLDAAGNFVYAYPYIDQMGSNDFGTAIATDASGNVYVSGTFDDIMDVDPGAGVSNLVSLGASDVMIVKLNPAGNFVWGKSIGNASMDDGKITVDAAGNVYMTGYFESTLDFDPGTAVFNLTAFGTTPGISDIYLLKLDALGNFAWAKSIGNNGSDMGINITTDPSGQIYSLSRFQGTVDFDPGPGTANLTCLSAAGADIAVSKWDPAGNLLWARQTSGGTVSGNDITADAGNTYITGSFFNTTDFDPGAGTALLTSTGNNMFIYKLDGAGNYVWAERIGGPAGPGTNTQAMSLALDASGSIYTTGQFGGTTDFDPGAAVFNLSSVSFSDIFIQKLGQCSVPAAPVNATPATNQTICPGSTAVLSATGTGTLNWYAGPASTGILGSGSNFTTTALSPGTYSFYVQAVVSCTTPSARSMITVTATAGPPAPTNATPVSNQTICAGSAAVLSASGATTINWYNSSTGTSVLATGLSYTTASLPVGSYTFYAAAVSTCTSVLRTPVTVTVTPATLPPLVINASQSAICIGTPSVSLQASGASSYTWNTTQQTASIIVTPTITSSYTLSGTGANGCKHSIVKIITVNPLPVINTGSSATLICGAGSVTLQATGAGSYSWSTGQAGSSIVVNPSVTTNYTVTGIDGNGCQNNAIRSVAVGTVPVITISISQPTICLWQSSVLTAVGAASFGWNTADNTASILVSPSATNVYTVTGTGANGCTARQTATLYVIQCFTGLENEVENNFKIYPNPTGGILSLELPSEFESATINVYDLLGKLVFTCNPKEPVFSINLKDSPVGIYAAYIQNSRGEKMVKKIVKQ